MWVETGRLLESHLNLKERHTFSLGKDFGFLHSSTQGGLFGRCFFAVSEVRRDSTHCKDESMGSLGSNTDAALGLGAALALITLTTGAGGGGAGTLTATFGAGAEARSGGSGSASSSSEEDSINTPRFAFRL